MQPPKCPVCGFEHWQIEGCGLSRKDVVDHKDPAVIAERRAEWNRQVAGDRERLGFSPFDAPLVREEVTQPPGRTFPYNVVPTPEIIAANVLYENVSPAVQNLLGAAVMNAPLVPAGEEGPSEEDLAAFDRAGDLTREVNAAKGLASAGFGLAPIRDDDPFPGGEMTVPGAGRSLLLQAHVRERGSAPVELLSDGVALKSTAHSIGPKGKRPRLHASALETVEVSDAGWTPEQKERAIMVAEGRYFLAVRKSVKMSQTKFSGAFGIPLGTLRGWESGRRPIPRCVMVLLSLIECEPEAVMRVILEKKP